jgi:hypothetical protein
MRQEPAARNRRSVAISTGGRVYLWLLSVIVMSGLDDTETLVAPSGKTLRKDAPNQSWAARRPRFGQVNFSVHSPQVSHLSARRAIGRAADLPRCGAHPAHRHCQRCYGPLPFRHQGGADTMPELRFWWQVQGSNLGRLSRRFYRPLGRSGHMPLDLRFSS